MTKTGGKTAENPIKTAAFPLTLGWLLQENQKKPQNPKIELSVLRSIQIITALRRLLKCRKVLKDFLLLFFLKKFAPSTLLPFIPRSSSLSQIPSSERKFKMLFKWIYVNWCEFMWIDVNLCGLMWIYVDLCEFMWIYVDLCEFLDATDPHRRFLQTHFRFKVKKSPRLSKMELSLDGFGRAGSDFAAAAINKCPAPSLGEKMLGSAEGWSRSVESLLQRLPYTQSQKPPLFAQKILLIRGEKVTSQVRGSDKKSLTGIIHLPNPGVLLGSSAGWPGRRNSSSKKGIFTPELPEKPKERQNWQERELQVGQWDFLGMNWEVN